MRLQGVFQAIGNTPIHKLKEFFLFCILTIYSWENKKISILGEFFQKVESLIIELNFLVMFTSVGRGD